MAPTYLLSKDQLYNYESKTLSDTCVMLRTTSLCSWTFIVLESDENIV